MILAHFLGFIVKIFIIEYKGGSIACFTWNKGCVIRQNHLFHVEQ